jgi:hypothetical protein
MTLPADDYSLRAVAAALERTQDHTKSADCANVEPNPFVDHDDLLALLKRPRPQHGDLRALQRRAFAGAASRKQVDIGIPISGAPDQQR